MPPPHPALFLCGLHIFHRSTTGFSKQALSWARLSRATSRRKGNMNGPPIKYAGVDSIFNMRGFQGSCEVIDALMSCFKLRRRKAARWVYPRRVQEPVEIPLRMKVLLAQVYKALISRHNRGLLMTISLCASEENRCAGLLSSTSAQRRQTGSVSPQCHNGYICPKPF